MLISLLLADQVHRVIETELSKRERNKRAEAVAEGSWSSDAVRQVLKDAKMAAVGDAAGGAVAGGS